MTTVILTGTKSQANAVVVTWRASKAVGLSELETSAEVIATPTAPDLIFEIAAPPGVSLYLPIYR
ncbi:MAG: hypothetical protein NTZ50_08695 [Chloroflexi bacterium]|nr:hypothetical protein [Chloroflexota bacterium]